jgi:hypothetical protein
MEMNRTHCLAATALLLCLLAGCDVVPPEYEKNWVQLQNEWTALTTVLTGGKSPLGLNSPLPKGSPSPSASPAELGSVNARNAKANAELLQEVYRTVFMQEPQNRSDFGSFVDSLNQGASIEGIYNGFTHSSDYRKLELTHAGASAEAIRIFGEELAALEADLPSPIEFEPSATQPLALPVQPGVVKADGVTVIEYGKPTPLKLEGKALAEKYSQQFVGSSIFTLKRVLGDEAMRVMTLKKEYPEKLAHWYSLWVVHMAGRGVDFGIAQRNQADEAFHYKWALSASEDRLRWEVLNRIHRVLNEANRQKQ